MKKRVGKILNFLLIFGTLALVLIVGVNGQEMGSALEAMKSLGAQWIVLCLVAYLGFVCMDALSIWHFLRMQGCRVSFGYMLFVANSGLYYSNITPGASGGQPMQVYYLHKKGVPIGLATSALMVRFFSFQAMLSIVATVLWAVYGPYVAAQIGDHMWILIIGYLYNAALVALLVLVALKKSVVRFLIHLGVRIGRALRLIRDPEAATAKCEDVLDTYHTSIQYLVRRPKELVVQLLIGGVQLLSLMTVLYFIYLGRGRREASYGQIVVMDVLEYISAAYMPLPGASGAQEVTFSLYFGSIFPEGIRLAALLLWRFFTYYLSLIVGAVITMAYGWRAGKGPKAVLKGRLRREKDKDETAGKEAQ